MRSGDLLPAKYMASEFKFGFELEGFLKDAYREDDRGRRKKSDVRATFATYFPEDGSSLKGDGSLRPASEYDMAFEWASPVLTFTPHNIGRAMKMLKDLPKHNIYTNKSCGFHVHLSFPKLKEEDAIWVLTQLSTNPKMFERVTKFGDINFFNEHYASYNYIVQIAKLLVNEDWDGLRHTFTEEKYRVLRIHPQGTIEWRGPRAFLNDGNPESVNKFFALLREFVNWISEAASKPSIVIDDNLVVTRSEFFEKLRPNRIFPRQQGRWAANMDHRIIQDIARNHRWLLNARFKEAYVTIENGVLKWHGGIWEDGVWENGRFNGGVWCSGTFKNGTWCNGEWRGGTWENGHWEDGYFCSGEWKNGTWDRGAFLDGIWHDGTWKHGRFDGGHWKKGTWLNGRFRGGTWHDGEWNGGEWTGGSWLPKTINPREMARRLERERLEKRLAQHAERVRKYEQLMSKRKEEIRNIYKTKYVNMSDDFDAWMLNTDFTRYFAVAEDVANAMENPRWARVEGDW